MPRHDIPTGGNGQPESLHHRNGRAASDGPIRHTLGRKSRKDWDFGPGPAGEEPAKAKPAKPKSGGGAPAGARIPAGAGIEVPDIFAGPIEPERARQPAADEEENGPYEQLEPEDDEIEPGDRAREKKLKEGRAVSIEADLAEEACRALDKRVKAEPSECQGVFSRRWMWRIMPERMDADVFKMLVHWTTYPHGHSPDPERGLLGKWTAQTAAQLSKQTGWSEPKVKRSLIRLRKIGFIDWTRGAFHQFPSGRCVWLNWVTILAAYDEKFPANQ